MYAKHVGLQDLVTREQTLKDQMDQEIDNFTRQVTQDAKLASTNSLRNLCLELQTVNSEIEKKKNETLKKKNYCGCLTSKGIKKASYIVIGLNAFAWVLMAGFIVYRLTTITRLSTNSTCANSTEVSENRATSIVELIVSIFALFLTTVIAGSVKEIDDDNDKLRIFTLVSNVKRQEEGHFQGYLEAFDEYKRSQQSQFDQMQYELSKCVKALEKLPDEGYRKKLPDKDHWVALMIEMMPDSHPIKIQFTELKIAALKILENEVKEEVTQHLKETIIVGTVSKEEESSTSQPPRKEKFIGEKLSLPDLNKPHVNNNNSPKKSVITDSGNTQDLEHLQQEYKSKLEELAKNIGTHIESVYVNNTTKLKVDGIANHHFKPSPKKPSNFNI